MKVGILGGGQLGRMLLQQSANFVVETYVLENDEHCPAAHLCHHFTKGSIRDFDTVYNFGKHLDAITIEIEDVNIEALEKLESEGVKIYPKAAALKIIKSKILQKQFYVSNEIPSPEFIIAQNKNDVIVNNHFLPAVHKLAEGGYDGKGVEILKEENDFERAFDAPSVLEKMVKIKKEIAIIVAMSDAGETVTFPAAEMHADPVLNLLDYQLSPAILPEKLLWKSEAIALAVLNGLKSPGLFAVELFIDFDDNVWVNETAPRVHNSGHHTIECNVTSQFEQHLRSILNLPLGSTEIIQHGAMINLLGAEGHQGPVYYKGLEKLMTYKGVHVHSYGKALTKPYRKMGHVTIVNEDVNEARKIAEQVKNTIRVIS